LIGGFHPCGKATLWSFISSQKVLLSVHAECLLTGRFCVIAGELSLGIAGDLQVERLVPEARRAEETNGRPETGQLGIPVARSATGMYCSADAAFCAPLNRSFRLWLASLSQSNLIRYAIFLLKLISQRKTFRIY